MALDTDQKRGSVIGIGLPFRPWLAVPVATIGAGERLSLLYYAAEPQAGAGFTPALQRTAYVLAELHTAFVRKPNDEADVRTAVADPESRTAHVGPDDRSAKA